MDLRKRMYEKMYRQAEDETRLTWHRESIPPLLMKAVELLRGKGKALDIGCGTGVAAVFMAQNGLNVTAIDYIAAALDFAGKRAVKSGVNIAFQHADVLKWANREKFELILDSGCLHSIKGQKRSLYKNQVLPWLTQGGHYILVHFGKKESFTLPIGQPVRKKPEEIQRFFSPELKLNEQYLELGPGGPLYHYWFQPDSAGAD